MGACPHRLRASFLTPSPIRAQPNRSGRTALLWLAAIAIVVAGMVWLTLAQIRSIAIDHAPTREEIAQCRAGLTPEEQAAWTEHCETGADIIWAARHPLRNALAVFVLLLTIGYATLALSRAIRPPGDDVPRMD